MKRLRVNFVGGMIEDDPLALSATTMTSQALSALPGITTGDEYIPIVIDPDGEDEAPEIVWIVEHGELEQTAVILREQEGTTARDHHNDIYWIHAPTAQDWTNFDQEKAEVQAYIDTADARLDQAVLDVKEVTNENALIVPTTAHALSDDFTTDTSAEWTRVDAFADPTKVTWRWGRGLVSTKIDAYSTGTGPSSSMLKSLGGMNFPITVETSMRSSSPRAANYLMKGILFSNSLATSGSEQIWTRQYTSTAVTGGNDLQLGITSNSNFSSENANNQGNWSWTAPYVYTRLIWVTTNVFESWISPDSINWLRTGYLVRAMTPTHFGMSVSTWNVAQSGIASFDFIRVFNANLGSDPSPE